MVYFGDAKGVLQGMVTFHSKDRGVSMIAMEMALLMAPVGISFEAVHIWSESNDLCDQVSRIPEGAALPKELREVRHTQAQRAGWRLLGTQPA